MGTNIENLHDEEHAKWHEFIDRVNDVVNDVFDVEEDKPVFVIGGQFGRIGREDDQPVCLASSNLPVCLVPDAVRDILGFVEEQHDEAHGLPVEHGEETGEVVKETVPLDSVPEEVRAQAIAFAESMGLTADDITFVEVADTSDLNDLPLFGLDDEQESKEETEQ